ncbi:MAG: DUF924 family protein [Pseudomonadota bacterium]
MIATAKDVIHFWRALEPKARFSRDDALDTQIREKFEATYNAAAAGQLDVWALAPESALALIIVLDQFSRNLHRDDPRAFASDDKTLGIVNSVMAAGLDRQMPEDLVSFCYMPLMHQENLAAQHRCVEQMTRLGLENETKYAKIHLDVIERFGRFPHRNPALGRTTTPEEQAFLDAGGFSA